MSKPKQQQKMKGNLDMIVPAVFAVMLIGIIVGIAILILVGFMDATTNADADQAFNDTMTAIALFIDWLPLIVTVIVAVVLLSLIFLIYQFKGRAGYRGS